MTRSKPAIRSRSSAFRSSLVIADGCASEQTHGVPEGEAVLRCGGLHRSELVEHPAESLAIDFDPASAHEVKAVRRGKQLLNLHLGQRFAVEADPHLEVEQRFSAES